MAITTPADSAQHIASLHPPEPRPAILAPETSKRSFILKLPNEILGIIASRFCPHCHRPYAELQDNSKRNLLSLCLVNSRWRDIAQAYLHHSYKSNREILFFLRTLIQRPDLARHVRAAHMCWIKGCLKKFKGSVALINRTSRSLGLRFTETKRWWAGQIWADEKLLYFLQELVLLHTPHLRFLIVERHVRPLTKSVFEHLTTVARRDRGRSGLRRLYRAVIRVGGNFGDGRPMLTVSDMKTLALVTPSLRVLTTELTQEMDRWGLPDRARTVEQLVSFPLRTTDFLANLTVLSLRGCRDWCLTPAELNILVGYCTGLQEMQFFACHEFAVEILEALAPLGPTLRRLRLSLKSYEWPPLYIWDGFQEPEIDVLKSFSCLEVLRLELARCEDGLCPDYIRSPEGAGPLMRVLPRSTRVLSIPGCFWGAAQPGISRLRDRVKNGELPHLHTLHLTCDGSVDTAFIESFRLLGVDMIAFRHDTSCPTRHEDLTALDIEGWT